MVTSGKNSRPCQIYNDPAEKKNKKQNKGAKL